MSAVEQIDAGLLNVGYVDAGPSDGPAVLLLHGWPYDIHSFDDVVPLLTAAGHLVIVPYLRGYGTTRFLADDTFRNGQQSVVAVDAVALMDALEIESAVLAGFDWGARTADIVAALWPERCRGLVSVSGYDPTFDRSAASFDNRITSRSSSTTIAGGWGWPTASPSTTSSRGDSRKALPSSCPPSRSRATPTAHRISTRAPTSEKFSGPCSHRTIESGIGHNLPQEAPEAFADAVLDVSGMT